MATEDRLEPGLCSGSEVGARGWLRQRKRGFDGDVNSTDHGGALASIRTYSSSPGCRFSISHIHETRTMYFKLFLKNPNA